MRVFCVSSRYTCVCFVYLAGIHACVLCVASIHVCVASIHVCVASIHVCCVHVPHVLQVLTYELYVGTNTAHMYCTSVYGHNHTW